MSRAAAAIGLVVLAFSACPEPGPVVEEDAGVDAGHIEQVTPVDAGPWDAGVLPDAGTDAGVQRIGWGNLQWPPYVTVPPRGTETIYGQVWIEGVTQNAGPAPGLEVQAVVGAPGSELSQWSFVPATFNKDDGNNDEWMATITAAASGTLAYGFRYRYQGGPWLYGDRSDEDRAGSNDGFQLDHAGKLAVRSPGGTLRIATLNLQCLNDDPKARLDAAVTRFVALDVDVIALQEVCEDGDGGAPFHNSAQYLAQRLEAITARPYRHHFAQTHKAFDVIPEGVGIVHALPLATAFVKDLPFADFARKAQVAVLGSDVGMIAFATAHLSFRSEDAQARVDQARTIEQTLSSISPAPAVLVIAGDFNTSPGTAPINELTDAGYRDVWATTYPGDPGYTHRSDSPTRRIDYLFVRDVSATFENVSREFTQPYTGSAYVSDHAGVFATVKAP